MKTIKQWIEKHIDFKREEEFVIFMIWALLSASIFLSIVK